MPDESTGAPVTSPVPPTPGAAVLTGLLADEGRRRVVAALALGAATVGEVRAATGMSTRAVAEALARLMAGDLVERGDDGRHVLQLVDEGFLDREAGVYRRAGGRVTL